MTQIIWGAQRDDGKKKSHSKVKSKRKDSMRVSKTKIRFNAAPGIMMNFSEEMLLRFYAKFIVLTARI